MFSYSDWVIVI